MNDLSMHIIDILQNSIRAGAANISLSINEDIQGDSLSISIKDDGVGMEPEVLSKLHDPFFTTRTTRRVGMGIPLLKHTAEQCAGGLNITSAPGKGTTIVTVFSLSHIDRPPIGDIAQSLVYTIISAPDTRFIFEYIYSTKVFELDTDDLYKELGNGFIMDPGLINGLISMIRSNINDLKTNS